jgi:hypothetical protein
LRLWRLSGEGPAHHLDLIHQLLVLLLQSIVLFDQPIHLLQQLGGVTLSRRLRRPGSSSLLRFAGRK